MTPVVMVNMIRLCLKRKTNGDDLVNCRCCALIMGLVVFGGLCA